MVLCAHYLIPHVFLQLKEGTLVQVPPSLVKRCKTHFHNLPCGATVILGNNGYVWISPLDDEEVTLTDGQTERLPDDDTEPKQVIIDDEHNLYYKQNTTLAFIGSLPMTNEARDKQLCNVP